MKTVALPILGLIMAFLPLFCWGTEGLLDAESLWLQSMGGVDGLYGPQSTASPEAPLQRTESPVHPDEETEEGPRESTRDSLLEQVDLGWVPPGHPDQSIEHPENEEDVLIRDRLEEVFIPKVEFRQVPLSQAIETLAEIAAQHDGEGGGLNMVLIDPEGRDPFVSILLRRLSLKRVLDFVVESVAYDYDLQADAVVIRPSQGPGFGLETAFYPVSRSTLIRLTGIHGMEETAAVSSLQDPFAMVDETGPDIRGETERALKGFLQRAGVPFEGIPGADLALADGQLIVTQTARNHDKVAQLLRRYRDVKQVEIEARFLEVQERNLEELGFQWTLVGEDGDRFSNAPIRTLANAFTVGQSESRIVIDRPQTSLPEINQGPPVLPISVDLGEDAANLLSLTGTVGGADIDLVIRALERQSGNDLLSAPKLTVLSGKTAEIVVAEEFRYPEMYGDTNAEVGKGDSSSGSAGVAVTAGTPRSFTTRNVGVEMEVTPTVEEDNAISLLLKPKVTEFEGFVEYGGTSVAIASDTTVTIPSGFYQPIFSIRKVQTEVTIWDGATVVMGGLTREHAVSVSEKVPVLGDIPLLGRLFRTEGESTQKRNLLIFVTAHLVSPAGAPSFRRIPVQP